MIMIGLGAGRTGTASLSKLINSQKDSICFHELNPTCAVFDGNFAPIRNTINEFKTLVEGGDVNELTVDYSRKVSVEMFSQLKQQGKPAIIGDIAYYYLKYVKKINQLNNSVKFVCLYRDKKDNVESWIRKTTINRWPSLWLADRLHSLITRTPFYKELNFWQNHDGSRWKLDPVWDKTFPQFEADSKKAAIEKYWDYYYEEAEKLAIDLPDCFIIIKTEELSTASGQKKTLSHLGVEECDMVLLDNCHIHKLS